MGQNISLRCVKRHPANSSRDQNRGNVNISEDTWLEALKFLTCPQWMQKRFVCRQINGIADRNITRLPKMVLDYVGMDYVSETSRFMEFWKLLVNKYTFVAFDKIMPEKQSTQWLKNRGFTFDATEDIPAENALVADGEIVFYGKGSQWNNNVNVCILGSEQKKIQLSAKERRFPWFYQACQLLTPVCQAPNPMLYYAQLSPVIDQYSEAYLAQFLKFIYHPTSYVKEVGMCAVNQNFIDSHKCNVDSVDNKPCYINCESFSVADWSGSTDAVDFSNLTKWLARNVRAEKIRIPEIDCSAAFVLLADFLLDPSGANQCASKKIKIEVSDGLAFLNSMIEKFHSTPLVENSIPKIVFKYPHNKDLHAHLGPYLIDQEVDSEEVYALYMILNGLNRMQISFCRPDLMYSKCKVSIYRT